MYSCYIVSRSRHMKYPPDFILFSNVSLHENATDHVHYTENLCQSQNLEWLSACAQTSLDGPQDTYKDSSNKFPCKQCAGEHSAVSSSKTKPVCSFIVTARVCRKEHRVDGLDRDGKQARAAWLLSHICPSDHSQWASRFGGLGLFSSGLKSCLRPGQHKAIKGRN